MSSLQEHSEPEVIEFVEVGLFPSIDEMWQDNWQKLAKSNDLKWIIIDDKDREAEADPKVLDDRFLFLMDEWYALTKGDSTRDEVHAIMKRLIAARNAYVQGDLFQINWINKYESMLSAIQKDNEGGMTPDMQRAEVSAVLGFHLDKTKITVVDNWNYTQVASNKNKSNTGDNG